MLHYRVGIIVKGALLKNIQILLEVYAYIFNIKRVWQYINITRVLFICCWVSYVNFYRLSITWDVWRLVGIGEIVEAYLSLDQFYKSRFWSLSFSVFQWIVDKCCRQNRVCVYVVSSSNSFLSLSRIYD